MKIWNSSWKCQTALENFQTILRSLEKFSKVSNRSQKSYKFLRSLKQFSQVSNSSQDSHIVLRRFKKFSEFLDNSWKTQTVLCNLNLSSYSKTVFGFSWYVSWSRAFSVGFCWSLSNCPLKSVFLDWNSMGHTEFFQCMDGPGKMLRT